MLYSIEPPPPPKMPPLRIKPVKKEHVELEQVEREHVKTEHATQTTVITTTEEPLPPEPEVIDYKSLELVITELYNQNKDTFLMYHNVPWTLHVRKEVYTYLFFLLQVDSLDFYTF